MDYRKATILAGIVFLLGCSANSRSEVVNSVTSFTGDFAEKLIQKNSGIMEEYNESLQFLDDAGEFIIPEDNKEIVYSGSVHVTFSNNNHLNVSYYTDSKMTKAIATTDYYAEPGDTIYYSVVPNNKATNHYVFDSFRLYGNNPSTKNRELIMSISDRDKIILPEKYTEISVVPVGRYTKKELVLEAYNIDARGNHRIEGLWTINDKKDREVSIFDPFIVKYYYDEYKDYYYFDHSEPGPSGDSRYPRADDEKGVVEFKRADPEDKNSEFKVYLRSYKKLKLINNRYKNVIDNLNETNIKSLKINEDSEVKYNSKTNSQNIDYKLKHGDKINIVLDGKYTAKSSDLEKTSEVKEGKNYSITFTVHDNYVEDLGITIIEREATMGGFQPKTIENGTLTVTKSDKSKAVLGEEINDSEQVTVIITPNYGYYVSGVKKIDDVYTKTMKYSEYVENIDSIISSHKIMKSIKIKLREKDDHGICSYTYDGKEVKGTMYFREGDKLKLVYTLTDKKYAFSDQTLVQTVDVFHLFPSPSESNTTITIDRSMNETEISREQFISIKEK